MSHRTRRTAPADRKSTRLNSSHEWISYAVFCLKKKNNDEADDRDDNKNHCDIEARQNTRCIRWDFQMICMLLMRWVDAILVCSCYYFFFNDTATTEIYTLSLHDALPI